MAKAKNTEPKEIKNGFIIKAEFIRETKDSFYLDCEGDPVWFPKSQVNFDKDKQDLEALNAGRPLFLKVIGNGHPPVALFTVDDQGEGNF